MKSDLPRISFPYALLFGSVLLLHALPFVHGLDSCIPNVFIDSLKEDDITGLNTTYTVAMRIGDARLRSCITNIHKGLYLQGNHHHIYMSIKAHERVGVIYNPKACLIRTRNLCCEVLADRHNSRYNLEDVEGYPICGQFLARHYTSGPGLAHWYSEFLDALELSYMFNLTRVTLPKNYILGHHLNNQKAAIERVFGFDHGLEYSFEQVHRSVELKYLHLVNVPYNVTFENVWQPELKAVYYEINAFSAHRSSEHAVAIVRDGIATMSKIYPRYHRTIFNPDKIKICVHIRRGDVADRNMTGRFLPNSYFIAVLKNALSALPPDSADVVVVSEGRPEEFKDIQTEFPSATLILNDDALFAVIHIIYSDILVASRSGFSGCFAELGSVSIILATPSCFTNVKRIIMVKVDIDEGSFDKRLFGKALMKSRLIN